MPKLLTEAERGELLGELTDWTAAPDGKAIRRRFQFRDFSEAWGFMSRVALLSEQQGHHPNWSNVWNQVSIELSTHDAGGLTDNDAQLARAINSLAA